MIEEKEKIIVEHLIYEIRGKQVMLDSDLAKLYQCKNGTKEINQAVRNNIEKFPERFSFKLSNEETKNLRSKFLTTNYSNMSRSNPRVFTGQGVAMLATILKSKVATQVSIRIMDAFVAMKKYISTDLLEQRYINNQVMKNTEDIKLLQDSFSKFEEKKKTNDTFFSGQIYDAYSKIIDIFKESKKELIIVDRYADKTVLDMIKKLNTKIILITKERGSIVDLDIKKYKDQYNNLEIIYDNSFHDRCFVIDKSRVYHCEASINHAGSKTFSINIIEDDFMKDSLIDKVNRLIKLSKNNKKILTNKNK